MSGGPTEAEQQAMTDWAENHMSFDPDAPGVLHGAEAAAYGRDLLARAGALPDPSSADPDSDPDSDSDPGSDPGSDPVPA